MKNLIKILTFSCFVLSSFSLLGKECYDDYCPNIAVFLSSQSHTFTIEGRVLFLKPEGNLHYVTEVHPLPRSSQNWKIHDVKPGYHAGFDIGVSYIPRIRTTNLKLNWEHLHCKDSNSKIAHVSNHRPISTMFKIGPDAPLFTKAKGKSHFQYDAIKLDGGIFVSFGDYLLANFYGGLNGTRIKQTLTSKYVNDHRTVSRSINAPSTFGGLGPQLGVDFAYSLPAGFELSGGATASILVGSINSHTTFKSISTSSKHLGIKTANSQKIRQQHRSQVIPAFEGRLGLVYSFESCSNTIKLEAGYEAKVFINAIQSTEFSNQVLKPSKRSDFHRHLSNFALSGPYISLNAAF
ncbi:MAG: hypothetical protein H0T62_04625 [Parachlamydiaceae bacterium]|nr:hypothetical protein [Parachlamydiaceae bacterium]